MKCENCGATIHSGLNRCEFCNSPIQATELSPEISTKMSTYIQGMEKILKAQKNRNDSYIALAFSVLAGIWAVLSYFFYEKEISTLLFITLVVLSGLVLFILFGFFVIYFEKKAQQNYFDKKLSKEIHAYLKDNNIPISDFKFKAMELLGEDSFLYNVLIDL